MRERGMYNTEIYNPFNSPVFRNWAARNNLTYKTVLEPFAGNNDIIRWLQKCDMARTYKSYDICSNNKNVEIKDTIIDYPSGYDLCITNPPWVCKNKPGRNIYKNIEGFNNVYKDCLSLALNNNKFIAMLLPASFINDVDTIKKHRNTFFNRIQNVLFLNYRAFKDTEEPVVLVLFGDRYDGNPVFYNSYKGEDSYIGVYKHLIQYMPYTYSKNKSLIKFNEPNGKLGLIAIDNTKEKSIRFCFGDEIDSEKVKPTSRHITRISVGSLNKFDINSLNYKIESIRLETSDVFLPTFKGLRDDGLYRRRLRYDTAREIITEVLLNE